MNGFLLFGELPAVLLIGILVIGDQISRRVCPGVHEIFMDCLDETFIGIHSLTKDS